MATPAAWYDEARVRQPGSVVLQRWMAEGGAKRARPAPPRAETQYTLEELARLYDALPTGTVTVTEDTAMRASAVYACVGLIAGSIASLPLPVYRRSNDGRETVRHDVWWLLNESPSSDITAAVFWEYVVASILLYGDGFARLHRPAPSSNDVRAIEALHPNRVQPFRTSAGELAYRVTPERGAVTGVSSADMLHFASLGFDGLRSMSPIRFAARNAVAIALSADEYSNAFFRNGARPDFALKHPGNLSPEQANVLRATWMARYGGVANSHLPAILTGGMGIEKLTMNAEDAQLIATRAFQIEEIARIYGVPPFMIGHNEKTTSWGSGVEAMGIGFVKYTLQRHLVRIEQELNRKLWPKRETYFVEFNTAGLMRGDYKTRMEGYRIALGRAGEPSWMRVNEIRRLENLPPDDELDRRALEAGRAPTKEKKDGQEAVGLAGA